ncbi:MAG TPA: ABC transporter permease [Candidatus Acidoferrum sp.]|nr:ABC transporter permease [Candidatus Acidoferrum sp.]
MDGFITALDGLPVIGLIVQFLGYVIEQLPSIATTAVQLATPIGFAALCGVMCERSGVVNIGIEGIMLVAAFVGWVAGVAIVPVVGVGDPGTLFGITPALLIALAAALASAVVLSLIHAWLSISVRANQIISGTIINIAAFGFTGYLNTLISPTSPQGAGSFAAIPICGAGTAGAVCVPDALVNLPIVGWLIGAVLNQGPISISLIVIVIVFQLFLFRSRWGLRTRAVGEHPKAAETVGIDVIRLRYRNVAIGGLLAGLGGAWLSMEVGSSFQDGMTQGRGFIGLAAMIVGRWSPLGAFGAALLFSSSVAISQSITFSAPTGQLGDFMSAIPPQFFDALPYLITIVVLAGLIGRSIPPAADGVPYEREATA